MSAEENVLLCIYGNINNLIFWLTLCDGVSWIFEKLCVFVALLGNIRVGPWVYSITPQIADRWMVDDSCLYYEGDSGNLNYWNFSGIYVSVQILWFYPEVRIVIMKHKLFKI